MKDLFEFLKSKGLNVYLNERNSIYLDQKKIGGNVKLVESNKMNNRIVVVSKN